METVSKILVLGLDKAFEITDDKTGEIIPGRKLYYAVPRGENEKGAQGLSVNDQCFMRENMQILRDVTVPGYYEAKIEWTVRGMKSYGKFKAFRLLKEFKAEF